MFIGIIIIGVYYLSFQIYVEIGKFSADIRLKELEIKATLKEIEFIEGKYREVQESLIQVENEMNKNRLKYEKLEELIDKMEQLVEIVDEYNKLRGVSE